MKKFLPICMAALLCVFGIKAMAQMSYGGEPQSFKVTVSSVVPTIEVEALDVEALLAEDASIEGKSHALRIGVTKDVMYTNTNSGRIDILPDGSKIWRLKFHMEGATFTSMNFSTFNIPNGAELYLYTPDQEYVIGKFTNQNLMEDGTFYPQELPGDEVIVEYYEPAGVAFNGQLAIDQISQGYYDFFHIYEKDVEGGLGNAEGTCHPNAICYDAEWHDQIQSVVCYTMTSGGYVYMCSGAMVNNTARDGKQYLLSANHCYEAGNWKFYFNYQATTCNGTNGSTIKTATGYTLKAKDDGNSSSDFMLVEITGTINPNFNVFLAGWNNASTAPTNPTQCGAIHHPGGDIKKFSIPQNIANGSLSGYAKFWLANWSYDYGTTEQGSSGSPLFNKDKLIVGQLYAGSSSCVAGQPQGSQGPSGWDLYGKLSNSWTNNNNSSNAKKLKPWLDPNNTGATSLQGEYLNTVGINNYTQVVDALNVYPNPNNGQMTISGSFSEGDGTCMVYDMMGNLVLSRNITLASEFNLNLNTLAPGMYMMEINDNTRISRAKIIISK
jgi:V8-like Glu-specific endopeptidase